MEREEAMTRLPETYELVLRLLDAGVWGEDLAARAGVAPQAIPALISVARAKLHRLLEQPV